MTSNWSRSCQRGAEQDRLFGPATRATHAPQFEDANAIGHRDATSPPRAVPGTRQRAPTRVRASYAPRNCESGGPFATDCGRAAKPSSRYEPRSSRARTAPRPPRQPIPRAIRRDQPDDHRDQRQPGSITGIAALTSVCHVRGGRRLTRRLSRPRQSSPKKTLRSVAGSP